MPYLVQAMRDSDSRSSSQAQKGNGRSAHFNLKAIVKRALVRAGLVEKYVLHCRAWKCAYREE